MKTAGRLAVVCSLFLLASCGGSTGFLGEAFPSATIPSGGSDSVTLTLEATGSHTGQYAFSAMSDAPGVTATVSPASAEVDGTVDVTVTIDVESSVTANRASVEVEAVKDGGDLSASTTISVTIQ